MPIEFRCTQCNKLLRTADESAGKKAKCPECGQVLRVPSPEPAAAPDPAPPMFDTGAPSPPQTPAVPSPGPAAAAAPGELGHGKLDLNDLIRTTWEIFKGEALMCILAPLVLTLAVLMIGVAAFVIVGVLSAVLQSGLVAGLLVFLLIVATLPLSMWLTIGQLRFFLNVARGQKPDFGDLFRAKLPEVWPFLGASLLFGLMVWIGSILLIVPGIIVATMFCQFAYLMADRGTGVFDSFGLSKQLTNGNKMTLFLTWLVCGFAAAVITAVTLGIASLATGPFFSMMLAVIYLRITEQPTTADAG